MYSRDDDGRLNDLEKIRSKHQNKKVTKKKHYWLTKLKRSVTSQFCEIIRLQLVDIFRKKKQDEKSPFAKNQPVNWWGHKHRYALITPYISF